MLVLSKFSKRITAILLATFISLISFVGCNGTSSTAQSKGTASSETKPAVSTQKNLLTVSVTISKDFLKGLESLSSSSSKASSDSASSKLAPGVIKDTHNPDGSETIVMTRETYDKTMDEMKTSLNDSIAKIKTSASSIKDIAINSGMNDFKVTVDKKKWDKSLDGLSLLGIYVASGMYQEFSSVKEPKATFHIIDDIKSQRNFIRHLP